MLPLIPNIGNSGFFLFLISLARDLSTLVIFSKNQLLVSWFSLWFFVFFSLMSALIFINSSCLLWLLICFAFSNFCKCKLRSLIWDHSSFLIQTFSAITLPQSIALTVSHKFWRVVFSFLFSTNYFLISLFVSSLIFELFKFPNIWKFSRYLLFFISNLIPFWSGTMYNLNPL